MNQLEGKVSFIGEDGAGKKFGWIEYPPEPEDPLKLMIVFTSRRQMYRENFQKPGHR